MPVKAALNGDRSSGDHEALPVSAEELARDALAVRRAGAFAVHVHPRDRRGRQSLAAADCDSVVAAIRRDSPGIAVGLSTAEEIDPDPFARATAVRSWRTPPDFVSVNVSEEGWEGIVRAAIAAGIEVEAGVANTRDAHEFVAGPFVHRVLRVLIEVEGDADEAREVSTLLPSEVPQLWHGFGLATWDVIAAGAAAGHDVRIGLEDVLVLPDGSEAASNAQLVATAVGLISQPG
jgi:uncharacterized protein (DUF849 family)